MVLATYTDAEGHLWVSTMRHAGVVYPEPSAIVAHGKKFAGRTASTWIGARRSSRAMSSRTARSIWRTSPFPYNAGDVLLIGAEGQGANKIEPVLIYETARHHSGLGYRPERRRHDEPADQDVERILAAPVSRVHHRPRVLLRRGAPRPGFMGRFIVGESTDARALLAGEPQLFGGQIGASANGDAPGDIYRLIGGVVLRRKGQAPDVRRLHRQRVPAAERLQQQPHRGPRVGGSQRPARREGPLLSWSGCGREPPTRSAARSVRRCRSTPCCRWPSRSRSSIRMDGSRRQQESAIGSDRSRDPRRGPWMSQASTSTKSARRGMASRAACQGCPTAAASSSSTRGHGPRAPRACASTARLSARSQPRAR